MVNFEIKIIKKRVLEFLEMLRKTAKTIEQSKNIEKTIKQIKQEIKD